MNSQMETKLQNSPFNDLSALIPTIVLHSIHVLEVEKPVST
jgi:hypothetical protein